MKRLCPRCQVEMYDQCYIKDLGKSELSYLQLIVLKDDYHKEKKEVKACYCPQCGYVELYIDPEISKEDDVKFDDNQQLYKTVEKYAKEHQELLKKETKTVKKTTKKSKKM